MWFDLAGMYFFFSFLPFYPHEFSGFAEPDFSSEVGDGEEWTNRLYFGVELKDETRKLLHL